MFGCLTLSSGVLLLLYTFSSCKHPYTHFETCHRTTEVAAPATTTTSLGQQITNHRQTAEFAFVLDELLKTSNGDAIAANGFNVH